MATTLSETPPGVGLRRLREALPTGRSLGEDQWRRRHRGILALLWAHVPAVLAFGVVREVEASHLALEVGAVAALALMATVPWWSRPVRASLASAGLLTCSAVLVHLSGGYIEMHFHFFVMIPIIALYEAWTPFLLAIAYVLVHHGLGGAIDPGSVYNHPDAFAHPWRWAAIHAFFISGISAASIYYWKLNERARETIRGTAEAGRAEVERLLRREQEARTEAETLNEVARSLGAELELGTLVQRVTDAATKLTGAAFGAFFHNVRDASGESYTLYTLSGVPREAFEKFKLPRNTPLFDATFRGTAVVRLEDVLQDPRYGKNPPHHGMPKGHLPVRSYLAVPVVARSGEVLGGLFFGHPEPGVFGPREERLAVGVASQAAVAIDNARLYGEAKAGKERLEELSRMKTQFLNMVAHELRTPMTPIMLQLQFLGMSGLSGSQARALGMLDRSMGRLHNLVQQLLDVARLESGKLPLERAEVDLVPLLREAVELHGPAAEQARVAIALEAGAPVVVDGDGARLMQVVVNLLSNAIKFTPPGGRVTVRARARGPEVVVEVADTGRGYPAAQETRLFQPFSQIHPEVKGGSGLGLFISRSIVEAHGGRIWAESPGPGSGATFRFALPGRGSGGGLPGREAEAEVPSRATTFPPAG